ncbi:hypothetical protein J1C56_08905 [Aminobacter anthyllidis]|uniref:Uncharacterized protein n=1 Tax=Aminobacter anthyllidis TaxID=1035067 RepID=A0A9X1A9E3_9HYPH|nr:hypothetical protein [Aminobacter anthyllidis]MBT1155709.1 hypothetical protein [Aminobacter anthyllidis]
MRARHNQDLRIRRRIEAAIEQLIALLDSFDPDPDLEPYLAGTGGSHKPLDDREADDSDLEPYPAWTVGEAAHGDYSTEGMADLEEQHDREHDECDGETDQWSIDCDVPQFGQQWHGHVMPGEHSTCC